MTTRKPEYLDDDDLDGSMVVPDGGRVRVPAFLMDQRRYAFAFDADQHRPHHAELTDETRKLRQATRDEYVVGLRDAWRSPKVAQNATFEDSGRSNTPDENDDPMRRRTAARDAYVRRLCDAWRSRPRVQEPDDEPDKDDPSEPTIAVERELETWQGRDPSDLARAVELRRRAVHAEFSQRLSNAWRLSHY